MRLSQKMMLASLVMITPMFMAFLCAQEKVDYRMIEQIRDEGFNRSQVMDIVWYLTDVYGPRLANSPSYNQAAQWTKKKFEEFGAENCAYRTRGSHYLQKKSKHFLKRRELPSWLLRANTVSKGVYGVRMTKALWRLAECTRCLWADISHYRE